MGFGPVFIKIGLITVAIAVVRTQVNVHVQNAAKGICKTIVGVEIQVVAVLLSGIIGNQNLRRERTVLGVNGRSTERGVIVGIEVGVQNKPKRTFGRCKVVHAEFDVVALVVVDGLGFLVKNGIDLFAVKIQIRPILPCSVAVRAKKIGFAVSMVKRNGAINFSKMTIAIPQRQRPVGAESFVFFEANVDDTRIA